MSLRIALPAVLVCLLAQSSLAASVFATGVDSATGTISGTTTDTLGAPNGTFVQLGDDATLTLSFTGVLPGTGSLEVFTFDTILPAAAKIELSADGSSFTELVPPPGMLWFDSSPTGSFVIPIALGPGATFKFIRFTDHVFSVDGDPSAGAGFDLDAVAFTAVPEPATSSLALMGVGGLALVARRRRRRG